MRSKKRRVVGFADGKIIIDLEKIKLSSTIKKIPFLKAVPTPENMDLEKVLNEVHFNSDYLDPTFQFSDEKDKKLHKYIQNVITKAHEMFFNSCEISGNENYEIIVQLLYLFPHIFDYPKLYKWVLQEIPNIFHYHRYEVFEWLVEAKKKELSYLRSIRDIEIFYEFRRKFELEQLSAIFSDTSNISRKKLKNAIENEIKMPIEDAIEKMKSEDSTNATLLRKKFWEIINKLTAEDKMINKYVKSKRVKVKKFDIAEKLAEEKGTGTDGVLAAIKRAKKRLNEDR